MQKIRTATDYTFFLVFNVIFSSFIGYICACLILYRAQPINKHILVPFKILLSRGINLFNHHSGGWWDNQGADILIFAIVAFIACFATLFIIYRGISNKSKDVVENFKSEIHGNARFADFTELEKIGLTKSASGVVMCKFYNNMNKLVPIINSETKHTLVIGGTGDNKTTGVMIPSLLSIYKDDYLNNRNAFSSAIIYDLKGSTYFKTAGWGVANGVNIIVLAPTVTNYAKFNIFNEININLPTYTDKIEAVIQLLMDPSGKKFANDDFWTSHGKTLLSARVAFEMYKNKHLAKNKTTLQKMAYMFRGYDLENDCAYSMETAFADMRNCDDPYIKSAGYMYESTEPRTFAGYLSTAQIALNLYVGNTLGEVTSDSTFSLHDLFYRKDIDGNDIPPTWLYLNIPFDNMVRLEPFVQLFFSACLDELSKEEDERFIKKYPTRIFADEFTKMGVFNKIGYQLGLLRGFAGIVTLLTQSLQDINNLYGKENTIITNCTYTVVFGVQKSDKETAMVIADQSGDTTEQEIVPTMSIKKGKGLFGRDEKTISYSPQIHKKTLMSPSDVVNLKLAECLVLSKELPNAVKGYKFKYFEDKEFVRRSQYPAPDPATLNSSKSKNIHEHKDSIFKRIAV